MPCTHAWAYTCNHTCTHTDAHFFAHKQWGAAFLNRMGLFNRGLRKGGMCADYKVMWQNCADLQKCLSSYYSVLTSLFVMHTHKIDKQKNTKSTICNTGHHIKHLKQFKQIIWLTSWTWADLCSHGCVCGVLGGGGSHGDSTVTPGPLLGVTSSHFTFAFNHFTLPSSFFLCATHCNVFINAGHYCTSWFSLQCKIMVADMINIRLTNKTLGEYSQKSDRVKSNFLVLSWARLRVYHHALWRWHSGAVS